MICVYTEPWCALGRSHHKNSNKQSGRPIGPYILGGDTQGDGATFLENTKCWLEVGAIRMAKLHGSETSTSAFVAPSHGGAFNEASFRNWSRKHTKAATGKDVTPNLFR